MNRERLKTAKKFLLEVLQPLWEERGLEKFNMREWITTAKVPEEDSDFSEAVERGHLTVECGTAGCFVGWLPTIFPGEFEIRSDGIIMRKDDYNAVAAACFFEIDEEQMDTLAYTSYYDIAAEKIQPKHVAEGINKILQGR